MVETISERKHSRSARCGSTAFGKYVQFSFVAAVLVAANLAQAQSNLVLLISKPGDYIGQGQTYLTTNTADFSASFYNFGSQQDIYASAFGYSMFFGGPGGANLSVGTYTNASRWPGNGSAPGLSVFGNGRACNGVCGNFQILELHADNSGSLDRLWLTFTQKCECSGAPLTGEIRYHSQLAPPAPVATTRHVPSVYPTIQAAINAASLLAVDTVLVAPGIYNESVQFNGKSVNLTTEDGPAQTLLMAPGATAISFANGEAASATVSGFTITNSGTAVSVSRGGAPTIVSNIIVNCAVGINCDSGSSDIEASPLIQGNQIIGCPGGAVSLNFTGTPLVEDNLMEGNGGGVGMWEAGSPTIYNNIIRDNHGDGVGMVNYSDANILQNAIVDNDGDGIYCLVPQGARGPWIFNNTIAGNGGAGLNDDAYGNNDIEVINNILVGNPALAGGGGDFQFNDFYPADNSSSNLVGSAGNISADPRFVYPPNNDFHLFDDSPCIDAGTNSYAYTNVDLTGNPRITHGTIDMGAYEFQAEHYVDVNSANPVAPYTNWATAATTIQDAVDVALPGDPILVTNGVYQTGGRVVYGALTNRVAVTKTLGVESVNGAAFTVIQGNPVPGNNAVRCVYLIGGAELVGFTLTNGATRSDGDINQEQSGGGVWCESSDAMLADCVLAGNAANLSGGGAFQGTLINSTLTSNTAMNGGGTAGCVMSNCDLTLNVATLGGGAVYDGILDQCKLTNNTVSNPPIYWTTSGGGAYGSTLNNCLLVTNSASGGGGAEQCVLNNSVLVDNNALWGGGADNSTLTNCNVTANIAQSGAGAYDSTLAGCTLGGNLGQYGGGAEYCTLTRCVLATNITYDNEVYGLGGGADSSTLNDCLVYGNVSSTSAGVSASTVNNCTIAGNATTQLGGAVDSCTLFNSVIYDNITPDGTNCSNSILTNCCTVPLPDSGEGNIANDPMFIYPPTDNFRLQSNSPCINSGNNLYAPADADLDSNPRIAGGTVDIGAYEYQTPASLLSYAWAQEYGLPTDGTADFIDTDGDDLNNWQEWIAGTNPTNALSVLKMLSAISTNRAAGITVSWQSVAGRHYLIQRGNSLKAKPPFSTMQTNIPGLPGVSSYTDTTATNFGPYFYRVGVQ